MKFSKHNRPGKRRKVTKRSGVDPEMLKKQLDELLAKCENEYQREALIKAYNITINP